MAEAVILPRQGQSVESCIITKWHKQVGDEVKVGEILFSYETDKAAFDEEAKVDGKLLAIFFEEDDDVPVLVNIAVIGSDGEDVEQFRPAGDDSSDAGSVSTESQVDRSDEKDEEITYETVASTSGMVKISPRARKKAESLGVNINGLGGSGPEGRIIERDIVRAYESGGRMSSLATAKSVADGLHSPMNGGKGLGGMVLGTDLKAASAATIGGEIKKLSNIRKIIASKMQESLSTTAQLTLHTSAPASHILNLRKELKAKFVAGEIENITINDLVSYALVQVLPSFPDLNCHFLGDSIKSFGNVDLGLAVDTERGLMVPTVRNAEQMDIATLAKAIKQVAGDCQNGSIDPSLLSGATFTMTNLGAFGIEYFTPVLNPPQVGILGVNTIQYKAAKGPDGNFGFYPYIGLSLTFDHRAIDGAPAAVFLQQLVKKIADLEINI